MRVPQKKKSAHTKEKEGTHNGAASAVLGDLSDVMLQQVHAGDHPLGDIEGVHYREVAQPQGPEDHKGGGHGKVLADHKG